jgi:hypothetical protein
MGVSVLSYVPFVSLSVGTGSTSTTHHIKSMSHNFRNWGRLQKIRTVLSSGEYFGLASSAPADQ